jgi:hypothetical protein
MGGKRRTEKMPDSPYWIEFGRSDGHSHLPKLANHDIIVSDEAGASIRWRREVASMVAPSMFLPGLLHDFALHRLLILFP